jgi:hypothetical protein
VVGARDMGRDGPGDGDIERLLAARGMEHAGGRRRERARRREPSDDLGVGLG